jgi:hypothetical protein
MTVLSITNAMLATAKSLFVAEALLLSWSPDPRYRWEKLRLKVLQSLQAEAGELMKYRNQPNASLEVQ